MRRLPQQPDTTAPLASLTHSPAERCVIAPLSVRIPIAVKMTGIGRSKLYELIQEGAIDVVKIGSATLIPVESLQRLLERNRR
jgi:excisionase family DNA binding protein